MCKIIISLLLLFFPFFAICQEDYVAKSGTLFQNGYTLYKERQYNEAIYALKKSYNNDIKIDNSLGYLDLSIDLIAKSYMSIGEYDSAIIYTNIAVEFYDKLHGKISQQYLEEYRQLLNLYSITNNNIQMCESVKEYINCYRLYNEKSVDFFDALGYVSQLLYEHELYDEAIPYQVEFVEIYRLNMGEVPDYASLLNRLAKLYIKTMDWKAAEKHYEKIWEIRNKYLPISDDKCDETLYNLQVIALHYDDKEKLVYYGLKRAEHIKEKYGNDSKEYALFLLNVVTWLLESNSYEEALSNCQKSVEILKNNNDTLCFNYAKSLSKLATVYAKTGRLSESNKLELEVVDLISEVEGENSDNAITAKQNLALSYINVGNPQKGLEVLLDVYYSNDRFADDDKLLNNLAVAYKAIGNYAKALSFAEQSVELKKKKLYEYFFPESYALSLTTLGSIYAELGDDKNALRCYNEIIENYEQLININKKQYGINTESYIDAYRSYALLLGEKDRTRSFISLGKIYEITKNNYPKQSHIYQYVLNDLANAYSHIDEKKDEAIKLYRELVEIVPPENELRIVGLANLGNIYMIDGILNEAFELINEAYIMSEKYLPKTNTTSLYVLESLIELCYLNGDVNKLELYIHKYVNNSRMLLLDNFIGLSINERNRFWTHFGRFLKERIPIYASHYDTPNILKDTYNSILLSKGLMLQSEIAISQFLIESNSEELTDMYSEIQSIRAILNTTYQNENYKQCKDSISDVLYQKEKSFLIELSAKGCSLSSLSLTAEDVGKSLRDHEVAIEFFTCNDFSNNNRLLALVLDKNTTPVLLTVPVASLDNTKYYRDFWDFMGNHLDNVKTVYFSPMGIVYTIPIESYKSDSIKMYRLSSTREIALQRSKPSLSSAVVYGGLEYSMTVDELAKDKLKYIDNKTRGMLYNTAVDTSKFRYAFDDLAYLYGTKDEAIIIDSVLEKNNINTGLYIGTLGTESSFKNLSGRQIEMIHIATHGFFGKESKNNLCNNYSTEDNLSENENRELVLCGLFMAGAENAYQGDLLPDSIDDGVLTALEISTMDLRGLDMVSLSACQTGQGAILSDGVYGLQRGFKKAGANSILMSLWKVDDNATCLLMTEFYKNWISNGMTKHDALEVAKQTVRSHTEKGWDDPKYWASFILLDALD